MSVDAQHDPEPHSPLVNAGPGAGAAAAAAASDGPGASGAAVLPAHAEPVRRESTANSEPDVTVSIAYGSSVARGSFAAGMDVQPTRPASGSEAAAAPDGGVDEHGVPRASTGGGRLVDGSAAPPPPPPAEADVKSDVKQQSAPAAAAGAHGGAVPHLERLVSDGALVRAVEDTATPRSTQVGAQMRKSKVAGSAAGGSGGGGGGRDPKRSGGNSLSSAFGGGGDGGITDDERWRDEFSTSATCDRLNPEWRRRCFLYFSKPWLAIFFGLWVTLWGFLFGWQIYLFVHFKYDTCEQPLAIWNGVAGVAGYLWVGMSGLYLTNAVRHPNPLVMFSMALFLFDCAWTLVGSAFVFTVDRRQHLCPHGLYEFSYAILVFTWIVVCVVCVGLVAALIYFVLDQRRTLLAANADRADITPSPATDPIGNGSAAAKSRGDSKQTGSADSTQPQQSVPRASDAGQALLDDDDEPLLPSWYADNFDGLPLIDELRAQGKWGYYMSLASVGVAVAAAVVVYSIQLALYQQHRDDSAALRCQSRLEVWNLVGGVTGFVGGALFVARQIIKYFAHRKALDAPLERDRRLMTAYLVLTFVLAVLGVFVVMWFAVGSAWTFGLDHTTITAQNAAAQAIGQNVNTRMMACPLGLYWFSFVIIVAGWAILIASLLAMVLFQRGVLLRPGQSERVLPL